MEFASLRMLVQIGSIFKREDCFSPFVPGHASNGWSPATLYQPNLSLDMEALSFFSQEILRHRTAWSHATASANTGAQAVSA